jgi:hypothetical protein
MRRTVPDIDHLRYRQWVSASHAVDAMEPALAIFIQGLGSIDAKLVHDDAAYNALSAEERCTFEQSLRLTERFAISHLWVLGAYEAVRTIDQRARRAKDLSKRLRQRIATTKKALARLRMPLAKFDLRVATTRPISRSRVLQFTAKWGFHGASPIESSFPGAVWRTDLWQC